MSIPLIIGVIEKKLDLFARNAVLSLLTICIIALLLRLYYLPYNLPITQDALVYFWYANDVSILGQFPTGYGFANNGWPAFLSIFFSIFHFNNFMDYMVLQRIITISISVLTIIPVYLLCNRFFDKPCSMVGASLYAFEPRIIQNSLLGITEPLYIILVTSVLVLFLSVSKKAVYASFGITALASLVRAEAMFLFLAISVMFFVRYRKEQKVVQKYALSAIIFILLLLPMAVIRIQTNGNDALIGRISMETTHIFSSISENNTESNLFLYWVKGLENPIKFVGWSMIPLFVFFVPYGTFLIFKNRGYYNTTIILTIIIMLVPALYALSFNPDTRYLYPLYPLLCIVSIFTVRVLVNKIRNRNIFLIFLIGGILLSSWLFLNFRNTDIEHEKEALSLAFHVSNTTSGINAYLLESGYLAIPAISEQNFPVLSNMISVKPKLIATTGFNSLEEYIKFGKEQDLTHLVLDGKENSKYRSYFLNDVFYHEEKYPYLTKVYDSWDHGYKYHLKIYKIDYERFDSITK